MKPVQVRLPAGGNPQIAKADADAPARAWIAAIPDGKRSPRSGSVRRLT